jgi:MFS family permease
LFELDAEGNVISKDDPSGVSVTYETDVVCGAGTLSLNFQVQCDEAMAEPAEPLEGQVKAFIPATIVSSSLAGCEKQIVFKHYTGCSEYSMLGFVNFLNENVWLSGTLLLIFGLSIGLFGQKWFLPITGAFAALCAFCAFMVLSSIFQWLNTTVGMIICTLFAIGFAGTAYWFGSRQRVASLLLCLGGGFMLGSIVEGLIIALFSWESMVFYLIVTTSCMVGAGLLGCYHPEFVNRWLTATVGSYIFMRGWTYYLGGYPSEMEMYNMMANPDSEPLDFNGLFWFYVALWVGGVFAFVYIQKSWAYAHGDGYKHSD